MSGKDLSEMSEALEDQVKDVKSDQDTKSDQDVKGDKEELEKNGDDEDILYGKSHCLREALDIVEKNRLAHDLPDLEIEYGNELGTTFTGCHVELSDGKCILSVQTNPQICGPAFCETALLFKDGVKVSREGIYGYFDVIRFSSKEEFDGHMDSLFDQVKVQ